MQAWKIDMSMLCCYMFRNILNQCYIYWCRCVCIMLFECHTCIHCTHYTFCSTNRFQTAIRSANTCLLNYIHTNLIGVYMYNYLINSINNYNLDSDIWTCSTVGYCKVLLGSVMNRTFCYVWISSSIWNFGLVVFGEFTVYLYYLCVLCLQ